MENNNKPTSEMLDNWHKDPKNWKWGVFYFNKNDKRVFPPKRIKKLGWTVNYANPVSILAIIVLVSVIYIIVKFIRL